jgi:hypothetical protein
LEKIHSRAVKFKVVVMTLHHSLSLFSQSAAARLHLLDATFSPEAPPTQAHFTDAAQSRLVDLAQQTEADPPADRTRALLRALAVPVSGGIKARPGAALRLLPVLEQSDNFSLPVPPSARAVPKLLTASPQRLPQVPTGSIDGVLAGARSVETYRLGLDKMSHVSLDGSQVAVMVEKCERLHLVQLSNGVCLSSYLLAEGKVKIFSILFVGRTVYCGTSRGLIYTLEVTVPEHAGEAIRWAQVSPPYMSQVKKFKNEVFIGTLAANADYLAAACVANIEVIRRVAQPVGLQHRFCFQSHKGRIGGMLMTSEFLMTWGGNDQTLKVWRLDGAPTKKVLQPADSMLQASGSRVRYAQICGNSLMTLSIDRMLRRFDLPENLTGALPKLGQKSRPYTPTHVVELARAPMNYDNWADCFAASDLYIAIGTVSGIVSIYQNRDGFLLVREMMPKLSVPHVYDLLFVTPTVLIINRSCLSVSVGPLGNDCVNYEHPAPQVVCLPESGLG